MAQVNAEAIGVALAPETTLKTAPGAGTWTTVQPNPGGVQGWEPKFKTVERDPLSKFATPEKGDNVGLDVDITLISDWNKDVADLIGESMFRCATAHTGNKGQSLYRPSAVTATGYTVAALGDLTVNLLIYARGFNTAANNGLKKVAAASTGTETKAPGLVAEAAPPSNATIDVVGVEGASGDIQIDASGNITSTVLNFTTMGLAVGMWILLPTAAQATAMGSAAYAFALYAGRARITAITATKLTLERRTWTVGGADTGAAKTIRLFFPSRFYRNYTLDSASYKKATLHGELEEQGPGTAGVATYTYAQGLAIDSVELNAPLEDKIVATVKLKGLDVPDPVLAVGRVTGPSAAYAPQASNLIDTATDLKQIRMTDATGTLIGEINSWKFTLANETKARKVQATFGGIDHTYGKFMFSVNMEAYYNDFNAVKALRDNRALSWDAYAANDQFGFQLDLPNVALRSGPRQYAANEPVMITCDVPAFRNTVDNIAGSLSVFGYVP